MDEDQLVRRVARGDRDAFDEFYRRTSPWLAWRLRRRCSDDGLVAEEVQETYLTVWRAAGTFAGAGVGGSAVGWVWTIAARRLVDALRRLVTKPLGRTGAEAKEILDIVESAASSAGTSRTRSTRPRPMCRCSRSRPVRSAM